MVIKNIYKLINKLNFCAWYRKQGKVKKRILLTLFFSLLIYFLICIITTITVQWINFYHPLNNGSNVRFSILNVKDTLKWTNLVDSSPYSKNEPWAGGFFNIFSWKTWAGIIYYPVYVMFMVIADLIYAFDQVFKTFALTNLNNIFGIHAQSPYIQKWFNVIMIIAIACFSFFLLVFVFRVWSGFEKRSQGNNGVIVMRIFTIIVLFVALPGIFYVVNAIMNAILNTLYKVGGDINNNFAVDLLRMGFHQKSDANITGLPQNNPYALTWAIGLVDKGWEPFIPILAGFVVIFAFIMICIALVQRIFNILLLYVVSPAVVITSINDEGNRLLRWKDLLIAKYLEASIFLICTGIYFGMYQFLKVVLLNPLVKANWFVYVLGLVVFTIASTLWLLNGQAMLCAILGTNTQIEQAMEGLGGLRSAFSLFRGGTAIVRAGMGFGLLGLWGAGKAVSGSVKVAQKGAHALGGMNSHLEERGLLKYGYKHGVGTKSELRDAINKSRAKHLHVNVTQAKSQLKSKIQQTPGKISKKVIATSKSLRGKK